MRSGAVMMKNTSLHSTCSLSSLAGKRAWGMKRLILHYKSFDIPPILEKYN